MDNVTAYKLGQFHFWHVGEYALLGVFNEIPGAEYFDWDVYENDDIFQIPCGDLLYGKLRLNEISTIENKRQYILGRLNRDDVYSEYGFISLRYDGQKNFCQFFITALFDVVIDKFGPDEYFEVTKLCTETCVITINASERVINYLYGSA